MHLASLNAFDATSFFTATVRPAVEEHRDPCNPSPCGPNAKCREHNGLGVCSCLPEYFGNPYESCRPECLTDSDCDRSKACERNKCVDPCPGVCGFRAECRVHNHVSMCYCLEGYQGDPFSACNPVPVTRKCAISLFASFVFYPEDKYGGVDTSVQLLCICCDATLSKDSNK